VDRSLRSFIKLALAGAAGFLVAYVVFDLHGPPEARLSTIRFAAAGGTPSASASSRGVAIPDATAGAGGPAIVSYRDAVARAAPSVVTVYAAHLVNGPLLLSTKAVVKGLGSGVIVGRDGYIVTNRHVVDDAAELAVALSDGSLHLARIVGSDKESDIALLKIDVAGLQPIAMADINDVAVGDVALAVGNPLGVGQTVTQGIISAVVRRGMAPVENFIQTDAAINPGNSGGALVDTAGRLVGINTAILSQSGGSEGIGFAIPVDLVQVVAATLRSKGRVARSWIGVSTEVRSQGNGALVVAIEPGGPADRAGIASGDVIVRVGEQGVANAQDVRTILIGVEPGTHVPIDFVRNGKRTTVDVLSASPPPQRASEDR
jgi:serine protease DegS